MKIGADAMIINAGTAGLATTLAAKEKASRQKTKVLVSVSFMKCCQNEYN